MTNKLKLLTDEEIDEIIADACNSSDAYHLEPLVAELRRMRTALKATANELVKTGGVALEGGDVYEHLENIVTLISEALGEGE